MASILLRRMKILGSLRGNPKTKCALVDSLDTSRSTIDRATRELETASMVEYVGGKFAVTTSGELVLNGFFDFVETVEMAQTTHKTSETCTGWLADLSTNRQRGVPFLKREQSEP
ncbi:hypothetical protein [Halopenitus persicus]|uniref:hypothetical protein n=1 Tax=Halopenitus persicus TaxID=1048396 RepID=UPI0012FDFE2B|nr:hypothetical protein [Halopenitus persicus]